jgi:ABC-type Fe3+/spermidine/putrescine transport system ATPase subunit
MIDRDESSILAVEGVSKAFGARTIVNDVSLTVRPGEFFCLLGPSGCGKTTLLRMIAGLERQDRGEILIDGRSLSKYSIQDRPLHMVFQSYALFPHLSVFENVAFGLRMKGTSNSEIASRVTEILDTVQLSHLKLRKPDRLSGGERQRVALARGLVNRPKILLLDEPLAAVDRKLRATLQTELKEVQQKTGVTFICVTHDQDEAMILSDRIGVMYGGRLIQVGTPHELYQSPDTVFAARFVGDCTLFRGVLRDRPPEGPAVFASEIGDLLITLDGSSRIAPGDPICCVARPERVDAVTRSNTPQNKITGSIREVSYLGSRVRLRVGVLNHEVLAEFPSDSRIIENARVGKTINLLIAPDALIEVVDDQPPSSAPSSAQPATAA